MAKPAAVIRLREDEQKTLRQWLRAGTSEQRKVERARIVLLASQGHSTDQIARMLHTRPARVSKWRQRFAHRGLPGLDDSARPGKPHQYDASTEKRVLRQLDQPPPEGYASWNGTLLAEALVDVGDSLAAAITGFLRGLRT
jgi:transposase